MHSQVYQVHTQNRFEYYLPSPLFETLALTLAFLGDANLASLDFFHFDCQTNPALYQFFFHEPSSWGLRCSFLHIITFPRSKTWGWCWTCGYRISTFCMQLMFFGCSLECTNSLANVCRERRKAFTRTGVGIDYSSYSFTLNFVEKRLRYTSPMPQNLSTHLLPS